MIIYTYIYTYVKCQLLFDVIILHFIFCLHYVWVRVYFNDYPYSKSIHFITKLETINFMVIINSVQTILNS